MDKKDGVTYARFGASRIGASHIRKGLPLQDAFLTDEYRGFFIAAVADGHGNRRHFRSDRGAQIACQVAVQSIREEINFSPASPPNEERMEALKRTICFSWREKVLEDYAHSPWTEEEMAEAKANYSENQFDELRRGATALRAYGSTLCAVFANERGWAALQVGDSGFTLVTPGGEYLWPMPESQINQGNRTASLCMEDPLVDFRHCGGSGRPAGLLVYTDGIEKSFPPQSEGMISFLHWAWNNERSGAPAREERLCETLDTLTRRNRIGDDVTIAGLADLGAVDAKPRLTPIQRAGEMDRLRAQMEEIDGTVAYITEQLLQCRKQGSCAEDIRKLEEIIRRKTEESKRLQARAEQMKRSKIE